jgi:hypothetical protein
MPTLGRPPEGRDCFVVSDVPAPSVLVALLQGNQQATTSRVLAHPRNRSRPPHADLTGVTLATADDILLVLPVLPRHAERRPDHRRPPGSRYRTRNAAHVYHPTARTDPMAEEEKPPAPRHVDSAVRRSHPTWAQLSRGGVRHPGGFDSDWGAGLVAAHRTGEPVARRGCHPGRHRAADLAVGPLRSAPALAAASARGRPAGGADGDQPGEVVSPDAGRVAT